MYYSTGYNEFSVAQATFKSKQSKTKQGHGTKINEQAMIRNGEKKDSKYNNLPCTSQKWIDQ